MKPEIKQMVTVSGRIRAEDGTLLAHAHINNHIGRTRTDGNGEFVMDIDKNFLLSILATKIIRVAKQILISVMLVVQFG